MKLFEIDADNTRASTPPSRVDHDARALVGPA
jgi:hypothetical protein